MNKKQIIFIILTAFLSVAIYIIFSNFSSDFLVDLNDQEIKWLKEKENQKISYLVDEGVDLNLMKIFTELESLLGVEFIQKEENPQIKIGAKSDNKTSYMNVYTIDKLKYSLYSSSGDYESISMIKDESIGMLESDYSIINMEKEYGISEDQIYLYQNADALKDDLYRGIIELAVLGNSSSTLVFNNQIIGKRQFNIYLNQNEVLLYVTNHEKTLANILQKSMIYLKKSFEIEPVVEEAYYDEDYLKFASLLTLEEKKYISDHRRLIVGIDIEEPLTKRVGDQIYGISVGVLNKTEELTGFNIEYIIGDSTKLLNNYERYNIKMLIINELSDLNWYESTPYIDSHYIVTGTNQSDGIRDIYQLRNHKKGILFHNSLSVDMIKELSIGGLVYYSKTDEMIQDLLDRKIEYILLPERTYTYYLLKEEINNLNDIMRLNETYNVSFNVLDSEPILLSIINKAIAYQDLDEVANNSMSSMPAKEDKDNIGLWTLALFLGVNFIFFGGYYIRYLFNKAENEQLTYLFTNDQLTYLPNKYGLSKRLNMSIEKGKEGALYYISLDNFKQISDRLGQELSDQIIVEYTHKLMEIISENHLLGRISGSTFVLISYDSTEKSQDIFSKIKSITDAYSDEKTVLTNLSATITVTKFPVHGSNFEELLKYAEHTFDYITKNNLETKTLEFEQGIYEAYEKERALVLDIKKALENEEFVLFIQPQVRLPEEEVIGGEILIRWAHPERGLIFPQDFLPTAERNGLMRDIDYYVLKKTCMQIKKWQRAYRDLKISVNMSTITFSDKSLIENVKEIIEDSGIDPSWLVIEVTEDMGFENIEKAIKIFEQLQNLGLKIALDDFGKGYSSLAYLEKLSFDILKIDKTLIDNIHVKPESFKIYNIISQLADIMNLLLVAEGVETIEQVNLLNQKEGTIAQGYYFSRPMNIESSAYFLESRELKR